MVSLLLINKVKINNFLSKGVLVPLCLFFTYALHGQNMVNNPSFEEYNVCPTPGNCDIASIPGWIYSKSGNSYVNTCNFSDTVGRSCAAPFNTGGGGCFQYPQDGNGMTYIENVIYPIFGFRSQLQTKLIKPLDSARCYYFSMYINLCDSCIVGTDDIGILFVNNFINLNTQFPIENFPTPQILHKGTFIIDKENWVKYEGTFTAIGGEEFMLIGSFSHPDSINTVLLNNGGQFNNKAGYFVDNIYLAECDSTVGVDEYLKEEIKIYPNPAQDYVSVDVPAAYKDLHLSIYNLTGQLITQKQITHSQQIPISELVNGMYIFVVAANSKPLYQGKFIVNR